MRIVAGRFKGTRLQAPEGLATRPTSDRAREALFNILSSAAYADYLRGGAVLDLFAGTGALGLEAISRGADLCHHYETGRTALTALNANIKKCRCGDVSTVYLSDAFRPSDQGVSYTLVFTDPPYAEGAIEKSLAGLTRVDSEADLLADDALIVAQLDPKTAYTLPEGIALRDDRKYGAARFLFLSLA